MLTSPKSWRAQLQILRDKTQAGTQHLEQRLVTHDNYYVIDMNVCSSKTPSKTASSYMFERHNRGVQYTT